MKKKVYHWQPELSNLIIYWSCTFGILFLSLILTLEYTRPYATSNIVLALFFLFAALGLNRYFILEPDYLVIHTLLPVKRKKITLNSVKKIRVGTKSIEITSTELKETSLLFIMTKKNKKAFIEAINRQPQFTAEIVKDDQLKMGKQD